MKNNSVRFSFLQTLFLFLFFFGKGFSQRYPEPVIDSLIYNGIKNIINQDYKDAKITFEYLDLHYPELPAGKIFIAATDIAKTFDYS